eukprot:403347817
MEANNGSGKTFKYEFKVGMSCNGCKNAINKLLGTETYLLSFDPIVEEQKLYVVGPEGIEQQVIDRLTKWATASKKELQYLDKMEVAQA